MILGSVTKETNRCLLLGKKRSCLDRLSLNKKILQPSQSASQMTNSIFQYKGQLKSIIHF